jgi:hypothetical protein
VLSLGAADGFVLPAAALERRRLRAGRAACVGGTRRSKLLKAFQLAPMNRTVISSTDLEGRAREIVESVRHGEMAVVETFGEEQIVLLDATDFRLLYGLAACATEAAELDGEASADARILGAYLADEISLGKAAEELGLSRFDLADRLHRLGISLPFGPASLEDARSEIATMRKIRRDSSATE